MRMQIRVTAPEMGQVTWGSIKRRLTSILWTQLSIHAPHTGSDDPMIKERSLDSTVSIHDPHKAVTIQLYSFQYLLFGSMG